MELAPLGACCRVHARHCAQIWPKPSLYHAHTCMYNRIVWAARDDVTDMLCGPAGCRDKDISARLLAVNVSGHFHYYPNMNHTISAWHTRGSPHPHLWNCALSPHIAMAAVACHQHTVNTIWWDHHTPTHFGRCAWYAGPGGRPDASVMIKHCLTCLGVAPPI